MGARSKALRPILKQPQAVSGGATIAVGVAASPAHSAKAKAYRSLGRFFLARQRFVERVQGPVSGESRPRWRTSATKLTRSDFIRQSEICESCATTVAPSNKAIAPARGYKFRIPHSLFRGEPVATRTRGSTLLRYFQISPTELQRKIPVSGSSPDALKSVLSFIDQEKKQKSGYLSFFATAVDAVPREILDLKKLIGFEPK
jgi:hypothetical protein